LINVAFIKNSVFVIEEKEHETTKMVSFSHKWENGRKIDRFILTMLKESHSGFKYFEKRIGGDGKTRHFF
jgi:hypothetical protein